MWRSREITHSGAGGEMVDVHKPSNFASALDSPDFASSAGVGGALLASLNTSIGNALNDSFRTEARTERNTGSASITTSQYCNYGSMNNLSQYTKQSPDGGTASAFVSDSTIDSIKERT